MATLPPLAVTSEDRVVLEGWLRARTTQQRLVQRARVALLMADGASNAEAARTVGLRAKAAGRWRRRFQRDGIDGLGDLPRSGRRDTPQFWERAADVCGLYLNPPVNTLALSVDKKTAIAARSPNTPPSRSHRDSPPAANSTTDATPPPA